MSYIPSNNRNNDYASVVRNFVQYHEARGFHVVPGSSLLDPSVPMSFVMSAGLVQVETAAKCYDDRVNNRYVLVQNCFRYFDLDNVGESKMHLSLFRMPGAFIFGPARREKVISDLWTLLTEVYHFSPASLWVSYFAGGEVCGHHFGPDEATLQAWLEVGLPPDRLVGLGPEHNFWKQGASVVGERDAPKCGANTEVFFDRGVEFACSPDCKPGCRCGRFVEFSNTLFITQHIDEVQGRVTPLAEPFTELVIGAERVAMLLQEKQSVFEIDSIYPLVQHVKGLSRAADLLPNVISEYTYIIVDHIRALLFLIADHAPPPGKGGRARLMRKLVRELLTAQKVLGISDSGFLPSLIEVALDLYAQENPTLVLAGPKCLLHICEERKRFEKTLRKGERQLDELLSGRSSRILSGEEVLLLEKDCGVPVPLLELMLTEKQASYWQDAYKDAHTRWYHSVNTSMRYGSEMRKERTYGPN